MKVTPDLLLVHLILLLLTLGVTSQECHGGITNPLWPNCTEANSAFCEDIGSTIIFRCFYPYGQACAGNCMDK